MRNAKTFKVYGLSVILITLSLCGCYGRSDQWVEGRPPLVDASGVATINGEPLDNAIVTFRPIEGNYAAFARTQNDGSFQLTTFDDGDGAVAGEFDVTVSKMVIELEPNPANPQVLPPIYHSEHSMIPAKYNSVDKSGLTATISEDGDSDLRLELVGLPEKKKVLADNR
ncbi:carboxypeptidase regulatory-like domain-containing protein [Bremerella alba]|uniref:Carboxypeptidase regulatory-like domain-containing protein n=1 Tax=Bremerella alba TaxID=980252 RepID=A0A7V9A860_9BACT|nr:carboxypeptidase regulatory-like domain-containing protein [Bremerella alba]MBA2116150.1 hypothetical protein [Bremerella alba]